MRVLSLSHNWSQKFIFIDTVCSASNKCEWADVICEKRYSRIQNISCKIKA